jgi:putative phage-type endonuclease
VSARVLQGSPEWLEARRATIGSSDIGVIVGESPWKDARTLAAEKLGLVEEQIDPETRLRMDIGTLLQPSLLRIYERITERPVRAEHRWRTHPRLAWATASLDGTAPPKRAVEAKWSNSLQWRGEQMPGHVQAQVQWQLFVTGWDVADVVVMDHGEARVIEVERDKPFIDDLVWAAERFRALLAKGELPEPDGSESSRRLITRMHPADDGTMLEPTPEWDTAAALLAMAKSEAKLAADRQATIENAIRSLLGDASGVTGDGYRITWKRNADSVRTNWPAVAHAYRELLTGSGISEEMLDTLQSIHSETIAGPRVLRFVSKESAP